jgi:ribosomal protein S18 acetylase RimI-like enzyme
MATIRIVDVTSTADLDLLPPCADPGFDHRSCDYWEDPDRGSKAARAAWFTAPVPSDQGTGAGPSRAAAANPFLAERRADSATNPFAPSGARPAFNPFDPAADAEDEEANPFAPSRREGPTVAQDAPRKIHLLSRGLRVFGTYAKVLLADEQPAAYCQFGPLSAYPRAQRVRDLYPRLPASPLPAVITCIATAPAARSQGLARRLVRAVVADLAARGFSAIEAYPERGVRADATSGATPDFWLGCGFALAVDDERWPVVRREL